MKTPVILLIDDDDTILEIYGIVLQDAGYRVITAQRGEEGLEKAHQYLPDVILCDVNMPDSDGRTLLQELRNDRDLANCQFVFMTGNPLTTSARKGMELGADDFLIKPINRKSLLQCLAARLRRSRIHWRVRDKVVDELHTRLRTVLPHELFTPLAGIVGLASVLREDWRDLEESEVANLLEEIETSGWRLERTLRNYLTVLGIVSVPDLESELTTAEQVEETVLGEMEGVAERFSRENDLRVGSIQPLALPIGQESLRIVLRELAENAFGFSDRGSPVTITLTEDGIFEVRDEGRGMEPEELRRVQTFRQFNREEMEQQGLGLGLSMVRLILQRSGGELHLESNRGKGTLARIQFPIRNEPQVSLPVNTQVC